jgi:MYXO-CTERM domain-containing protein
MEFQMRNKTFISSMVGVAAAAAVAGSANAAIVSGPGVGSNCATFDGATSTTITYDGYTVSSASSWASPLLAFSIRTRLYDGGGTTVPIAIGLIEYSYDAGVNYSTYSTSSLSNNVFGATITPPANTVTNGNFRVRVTIPANVSLVNNLTFAVGLDYDMGNSGGGRTTFFSSVVPAPGALALLGAAGLVGARRRR